MRANLQDWVRNIESYGLAKGAGQAFLDETADTDTADLPPAAAKAASQLWGAIKMSCSRDPVMVVVIETLQSGTPRRYLNGGWLLQQLITRLPKEPNTKSGKRSVRERLEDACRAVLPENATELDVKRYLTHITKLNGECGSEANGKLNKAGIARVLSDAVPESHTVRFDAAKAELIKQRAADG